MNNNLETKDSLPIVYMTTDISPKSLVEIYKALGKNLEGKVAVKVSTGEPPNSNYLRPELIKDLVELVSGTIVECNTAYSGRRSNTEMHYEVAKEHGFTAIADVDIQDKDGSMVLPVIGGEVLTENYVGKSFIEYDSYLVLSHFKGHVMGGFGGAIKNISIGMASAEGKFWIHTGGQNKSGSIMGEQNAFNKSMAEAGKSVSDALGNGKRILYINVLNFLSIDCDCNGNPALPEMRDIGILASIDPVAVDKASMDLIQKTEGNESFLERVSSRNGMLTLEHAEKIGLGNSEYKLVSIDG